MMPRNSDSSSPPGVHASSLPRKSHRIEKSYPVLAREWVRLVQPNHGFDDTVAAANIDILVELLQEGYITERDIMQKDRGMLSMEKKISVGPMGLIVLGRRCPG